ncbi:CRP-like cAMP-binding protein [Thermocatellispora tengchongensis]|uniref:CRP-like cAMP-binding protein n=1 Tax=Thermocatellispora tengchongensis TaxID=1073253 RepID=A0A840NPX7_9ACTN|nr:Crp/Fnr family transcriptional regulator [Thermocatellispora tengchongensis]MBB5130604.1 CRP-like cAMP-binding protein [Thermocatellispora tengchongensis]
MAALDQRARDEFLALGEPRRHESGEVLIHQHDLRCDRVYLLRSARTGASACAKVTANLDNGMEILLGVRVHGDLIGEMGVLRGAPRSATVTVCSPSLAYRIPASAFLAFLDRNPRVGVALAGMIAERLQWANQRRLDFAAFDVQARLARVIGELARRHGVAVPDGTDLGVTLSQQELGLLVGARDAAVGKAMRALREGGALRTRYRRIIITDPVRLEAAQRAT